ncbi:MAG: efflux RND transporter periplasmic adaptor subunit [Terriglobales bacterium]
MHRLQPGNETPPQLCSLVRPGRAGTDAILKPQVVEGMRRNGQCVAGLVLTAVALGLTGCGGSDAAGAAPAAGGGGRGGGMPAMPVMVQVVQPQPVADTSTYVASIQSLDSMTISPLVPGIIRNILVKSGDSVAAGAALVQLDPALQQAQVANLVSSRAALDATIEFDQTQLKRAQRLYEEKIGTQQDFQQAQSTYNAAVAQANSLDAQIAQAKTSLSYFRVTAPRAGVVGDIPVKVGDQVTTASQLTTLDSPSGLQVYVAVPIEQSAKLRVGLPVEVLNGQGQVVAQSSLFFVSPQVDYTTQSILVKANLSPAAAAHVRTQQYVQARITWSTHTAMVVPVLAVTRQGTSPFVDVAAPQGQGFAVHLTPVTLGPVEGNNYEVTGGLNRGDRVIVSTTQILGEGMPVMPMPAGGRRGR